jgi:glycosyltransferase involved in cell wall biosynthesis
MNDLRISVIIPTYNGARWLPETIASVLAQTYCPAEIIVVNDGSTDDTASVLRRFEPALQVVHRSNGGIGAARNSGLEVAGGDFVAFLDHDDLWRPDKLQRQVDYLRQHPDIDVLYSDAEEFNENGSVHRSYHELFSRLRRPGDRFEALVRFSVPLMSTVLIRAEFLHRHQLRFIEPASGVDDIGLLLEISALGGRFGCLDECLTFRRLHTGNTSGVHYQRFARRIVLYRELLDRFTGAPAHQRRLLRWGLRQACWRVGEWHWGRLQIAQAREHFQEAVGWDGVGFRAGAYALACGLPLSVIRSMQQAKRWVQGMLGRGWPFRGVLRRAAGM